MKQVVTLILAASLYVPHMAKLLAYVDCSYIVLSNQDPLLCDCNRIVDADMIPFAPDNPDKQKEISLKADWKYVRTTQFQVQPPANSPAEISYAFVQSGIPQQCLQSVFHPPRS